MEKIGQLVKSKLFIFICTAYFFLVWVTGQEAIGLTLALLATSFLLIFYKDLTGVTTVMSLFLTGISLRQFPFVTVQQAVLFKPELMPAFVWPILIVGLVTFAASVIIHLVRFKVSSEIWRDPLTYCFFAIFSATLLSGIFSPTFSFFVSILISLLYFILFLAYRLFKSCQPDFDIKEYVALIVVMIGLSATVDTGIYFIRTGDFFTTLTAKILNIGWGVTNSIAPFIVMAIPMSVYLYVKKRNFLYLLIAALQLAGLFLTMSRGEIGAFALVSPFLVFFLFRYAKSSWGEQYKRKRFELIGMFGALAVAVAVVGIIKFDYFVDFVSRIASLSDSSRSPLRLAAAIDFVIAPLFGSGFSEVGFGFGLSLIDGDMVLRFPHSILFNIFSTMGIFGACIFGTYYYFKYRHLLTHKSMFGVFALLSIVPFAMYAFADPTFYFVQIQFVSVLILEARRREAAAGECTEYRISALYRKALFKNKRSTLITLAAGAAGAVFLVVMFFMFGNEIYIINLRASYIIMVGIACLVEITLLPSAFRVIKRAVDKRKNQKSATSATTAPTDISNDSPSGESGDVSADASKDTSIG